MVTAKQAHRVGWEEDVREGKGSWKEESGHVGQIFIRAAGDGRPHQGIRQVTQGHEDANRVTARKTSQLPRAGAEVLPTCVHLYTHARSTHSHRVNPRWSSSPCWPLIGHSFTS